MKRKHLFLFLKLILTVGALIYVIHVVPFGKMWETISRANLLWLFPALFLFVVSKYFSAIRLHFLFATSGVELSPAYNIRLYLLGMFYNLFLPGGVSGDGYKAYLLNKQKGYDLKMLARQLLSDRLSGLAALGAFAGFLCFFVPEFPYKLLFLASIPFGYLAYYFLMKQLSPTKKVYAKAEVYSWFVQISQLICAIALLFSLGQCPL